MSKELETVNKLYLELSTIATAKTKRELDLLQAIQDARDIALDLCYKIEVCGASEKLTAACVQASTLYKLLDMLSHRTSPKSAENLVLPDGMTMSSELK